MPNDDTRIFLTKMQEVDDELLRALRNTLPAEREALVARAGSAARQKELTLGFCLLRHAVKTLFPTAELERIVLREGGKPAFASGFPFFNLSHTKYGLAVALSPSHEVGVDLEVVKEHHKNLAARIASPEERAMLDAASDEKEALVRLFSLKEAVAKESGRGLAQNLRALSIAGGACRALTVGGVPHILSLSPAAKVPEPIVVLTAALLER